MSIRRALGERRLLAIRGDHPLRRLGSASRSRTLASSANSGPFAGRRSLALAQIEAALFSSSEPLSARRLAQAAGIQDFHQARRLVEQLNNLLEKDRSGFRVEELAGGYQLLTLARLQPFLDRLSLPREHFHLSGPLLETLAIIAYRQPIGRAEIEAVRQVQVGEILRQLMDKQWVRITGKEESLGRPFLYGTTKQFLEAFGLRSLRELPTVEQLTPPG